MFCGSRGVDYLQFVDYAFTDIFSEGCGRPSNVWFNLHKVWRSTQSCFITWPQLTFEEIFVMFFVLDFGILHLLSQNIIPQTKPTCDQFLFQWGIHFVLCSISLWILMVIRYPPFCPLKIYVFLFQRKSDFALYTEALKFFDHKENMVRIAVRTLTLNVYKGEWMGCQWSWCYRYWIFFSIIDNIIFFNLVYLTVHAFVFFL